MKCRVFRVAEMYNSAVRDVLLGSVLLALLFAVVIYITVECIRRGN